MRRSALLLVTCVLLLVTTSATAEVSILNAFNSGELSPLLEGRTDLAKYYSGAQTVENLVVLSYGGVQKRPGTKFIARAKHSDAKARLMRFEFSADDAYIIEVGNLYMRFYRDGGQIFSGGSPFQIVTPYVTADLFKIQIIQSADRLYLAHSLYPTKTLTRTSDIAWTLADLDPQRGPFLAENITATTITPSAATGTITLTASSAIFNADHVGALWQVTHTDDADSESESFTTGGAEDSNSITVQLGRSYNFSTHDTWTGTIFLQRSYDAGVTWKDVRPVHYEDDGNISLGPPDGTENVADAIYRVHKEASGITSGTCSWNFIARSFDVAGVVKITVFTNTSLVTGTVQNTLGDTTATAFWAEGAWSTDEGFPSALAFYQERLCLAGTTNSPQTIWMSQTDDWNNFLAGDLDTSSLSWTLASDTVDTIRWLGSQRSLLIGTSGAEWKLDPAEPGVLSPFNVKVDRQTSNGSADIQAVNYNNVMIYAERQARKIRELAYSFTDDAWVTPDLTVLSEHITEGGITEMALQKTPDPTVWCVRADGELLGMTYKRDQDVVGWHRHNLGGQVETAAVIPGDGEDELWVIVKRTVDGQDVRYVEQFQPRQWENMEDAFYVDAGLSFDGGPDIAIQDITLADPGVVTAADHGFSDGDQVRITDVVGMSEINDRVYTVDSPTRDTFILRDVDDEVDWNTRFEGLLLRHDPNFADKTYPTGTIGVGGSQWVGQTFELEDTTIITRLDLRSSWVRVSTPTTLFFNIRSGGITGTVVASGSRSIVATNATQDTSALVWETLLFNDGIVLPPGTYGVAWGTFVSSGSGGQWNAAYTNTSNGEPGYSDGVLYTIVVVGGEELSYHENATLDGMFRIYGKSSPLESYISGGLVRQVEDTFDNLGHLEGETLIAAGDGGSTDGDMVVTNGRIRLGDFYNTVHAGLPFDSLLVTRRLEVQGQQLQGRVKRINELVLRLNETRAVKFGPSRNDLDTVIFRDADDPLEAAAPLFSGDKREEFEADFGTDSRIWILADEPLPFTLTAIMPFFEVYE